MRYLLVQLFLLIILLSSSDMQAAERKIPLSQAEITLSYAPVVKQAAPAVVNIYASKRVKVRVSPFLSDPFFERFFGENPLFQDFGGRTREKVINSLGSGVIVSPDGLIITNLHVIKEGDDIKVVLSDRREYEAEIVLTDARSDLALLQIDGDGETLPYLGFAPSGSLEVGDIVLAIGNPFGVGQTVTSGIVSALARTTVGITDFAFFIQTDAAINPGNSGGALVNMQGELVGINTAIFSKTGASHGIGFATPAIMANIVLNSYNLGSDRVIRPWLGASTQDITKDIAASLGLRNPSGVLVKDIYPNSAAYKAGLKRGDIITHIDNQSVYDEATLKFHISTYPIGETVRLSLIRDGNEEMLQIMMEPPSDFPPRNTTELEGKHPLSGAIVENLSPAVAETLGITHTDGVILTDIKLRSTARRFFEKGDIILKVNDEQIQNIDELKAALDDSSSKWNIVAKRGNQKLTISISM